MTNFSKRTKRASEENIYDEIHGTKPQPIETKGQFGGLCNLSRCKTGLPATWYNYGTRNYYCRSCAAELNADPYNAADALRLFGHELCIHGEVDTH